MKQNMLLATIGLLLVLAILPLAHAEEGSGSGSGSDDTITESDDSGSDSLSDTTPDDSSDSIDDSVESSGSSTKTRTRVERDGLRIRTETRIGNTVQRERLELREGETRDDVMRIRLANRPIGNLTVDDLRAAKIELEQQRKELRENRRAFVERVKQEIEDHKERMKELQEEMKEKREDFKQSRDDLRVKCKTSGSEECKLAKAELNTDAADFMGNAAEQMLRRIATTKERVLGNQQLDNVTAAKIITKLDAHTAAITNAQNTIEGLGNNSDINATKAAAEALRTSWTEAKVTIRLTDGLLVHTRFDAFLDHLDRMELRLQNASTQLNGQGKDTAELDLAISAFGAKIDATRTSYNEVVASYISVMETATTEAQANELLKESREKLKTLRDDLQDAREDLRKAIAQIRLLSKEILADVVAQVAADAQANAEVETEVSA